MNLFLYKLKGYTFVEKLIHYHLNINFQQNYKCEAT